MKHFALAAALVCLALPAAAQSPSAITAYGLRLDTGVKAATATAGAATLAKSSGVVTTEALSTAAGTSYTLTLTDSLIGATDLVFASVAYGSASAGEPHVMRIQPAAGSVVIVVRNSASAAAFNGTLRISFFALKN